MVTKSKDEFEVLADKCMDKHYSFEIDDMLVHKSVTDIVEYLAGPKHHYTTDLTYQIVKLILHNRIKSEHSGHIRRF